MHPSVARIFERWTRREETRSGPLATDAEERVRLGLARIGASGLYPVVRRNAHLQDQSYADAMNLVADHLIREGLPPAWSLED
jgi:hypothetical protein